MTNLHSGRKTCRFRIGAVSGLIFYVLRDKLSERDLNNLHYVGLDSITQKLLSHDLSTQWEEIMRVPFFLAQCSYIFSFFLFFIWKHTNYHYLQNRV